jgi:UDP-N-acetylglucosamine 4,6-dehydratase
MTRFWLTLEQGVDFVVRCLGLMQGGEVFVPKIPSMRIVDLARVIAPDADLKSVGIRPGEKIHEVLISEDEARSTIELDDMYTVLPPARSVETHWGVGRPVPDGFRFTSENNARWLSADDLRTLIELR